MKIVELHSLTDAQIARLQELMRQLDAEIVVTAEMLREAAASPATHLFAAVEGPRDPGAPDTPVAPGTSGSQGALGAAPAELSRLLGCASLCVFSSPTGRKATIEDVVVDASQRGRHIGKALIEHILAFAQSGLAPVEIHLTSRPHRVAANALYASLGFQRKETNVYTLQLK